MLYCIAPIRLVYRGLPRAIKVERAINEIFGHTYFSEDLLLLHPMYFLISFKEISSTILAKSRGAFAASYSHSKATAGRYKSVWLVTSKTPFIFFYLHTVSSAPSPLEFLFLIHLFIFFLSLYPDLLPSGTQVG